MVKFSFIVPVYNIKQTYLKQCIDSLMNQTLKNFEILLIDDGSTNDAGNWCDLYAKRYNNYIRVIHKKNEGVSVARNIGINEAKGEYLLFVDPDDWIEPNLCEELNSILNKADVDILYFSHFRESKNASKKSEVDSNTGTIHEISEDEKGELIQNLIDTNKKADYKYYHSKIFGASWGKCFKRLFIVENNLSFKRNLVKSQDTVFNLYAFYAAKNIIEYNRPLYHYRMVKSSVTHRYNKDMIDIQLEYLGEIKKFLSENGLNKIYQEAFMHVCILAYFNVLRLDIFNSDNDNSISNRREEWRSFIKTDYIKNLNSECLQKYSWTMRLFMAGAKNHLFYITWILYFVRDKLNHKSTIDDDLYE